MILFVNACVRGERSRTLVLCRSYLGARKRAGALVREVNLEQMHLLPLSESKVAFRSQLARRGVFEDDIFDFAQQFADADEVVIGAPYWDLTFPASLKAYIEHVSVDGITFRFTPEAHYEGLCRASRITYVTTSGSVLDADAAFVPSRACALGEGGEGGEGEASAYAHRAGFAPAPGRNLGYDYLCAIARMFGIPEVRYVSVEGLDVEGANINDLMDGGLAKIDRVLEEDAALASSAE